MSYNILPPKIGLVSGIGPLAGTDVLVKLFKQAALEYDAVEDHEYPDVVLVNHGIENVGNTATLNSNFEKNVISMIKQLENDGANIIGIACNTAHAYLQKVGAKPTTTIVNLLDEVAEAAAHSDQNYLLLTSAANKQQQLSKKYLTKHGVKFQETTDAEQQLIDKIIALVMAHELDAAGAEMEQVL